jgi:hypothetical protein
MFASVSLRAQTDCGPAVHTTAVSFDDVTPPWASYAKGVAVTGIGQRLAMRKDDQAVWPRPGSPSGRISIPTWLSVDGANFNDPGNWLLNGSCGSASQRARG